MGKFLVMIYGSFGQALRGSAFGCVVVFQSSSRNGKCQGIPCDGNRKCIFWHARDITLSNCFVFDPRCRLQVVVSPARWFGMTVKVQVRCIPSAAGVGGSL